MRVEFRIEENEHEWEVSVQADGSVDPEDVLNVTVRAMQELRLRK